MTRTFIPVPRTFRAEESTEADGIQLIIYTIVLEEEATRKFKEMEDRQNNFHLKLELYNLA